MDGIFLLSPRGMVTPSHDSSSIREPGVKVGNKKLKLHIHFFKSFGFLQTICSICFVILLKQIQAVGLKPNSYFGNVKPWLKDYFQLYFLLL